MLTQQLILAITGNIPGVPFKHFVLRLPDNATVEDILERYKKLLHATQKALTEANAGTDYNVQRLASSDTTRQQRSRWRFCGRDYYDWFGMVAKSRREGQGDQVWIRGVLVSSGVTSVQRYMRVANSIASTKSAELLCMKLKHVLRK